MEEREYVKTSDLDLAAAFLACGFPIDGIYARPESETLDFYFEKSEHLEKTMTEYWNRELRIEPLLLFSSRREILTRMRVEREREKSSKKSY